MHVLTVGFCGSMLLSWLSHTHTHTHQQVSSAMYVDIAKEISFTVEHEGSGIRNVQTTFLSIRDYR